MRNPSGRLAFGTGALCAVATFMAAPALANADSNFLLQDPGQNTVQDKPADQIGPDSGFRTDPRQDSLLEAEPTLDRIRAEFPDTVGTGTWDMAQQTLTYNVVGSADDPASQAGRFAAAVAAANFPFRVLYRSVAVSPRHLQAIAEQIGRSRAPWAAELPGYSYSGPDEANGAVVVGVEKAYADEWKDAAARAPFDVPITIRPEEHVGIVYESRVTDSVPWAGGDTLTAAQSSGPNPGTVAHCTGGFTWKRWSGGGAAASTAEHCVNDPNTRDQFLNWKNNGVLVGAPSVTSPASDTALLQGGGSYAAGIWVGAANSTTYRTVTTASPTDFIGESVALSGAVSGGPVGTVAAVNQSFGLTTVTVMNADLSSGGDSGAPWLQTHSSDGTVNAKGQHAGKLFYNGAYRSAWVPVVRISAYVHASIATTP